VKLRTGCGFPGDWPAVGWLRRRELEEIEGAFLPRMGKGKEKHVQGAAQQEGLLPSNPSAGGHGDSHE